MSKEIEMQKKKKPFDPLEDFPTSLSDSEVLYWLRTREVDIDFLKRLKDCSASTDDIIAGWLNISVRTLRNYRNPAYRIRENIKEQALLLMALFVHGNDVFGNAAQFNEWLNTENWRSMGGLGTLQKSGSQWYDRQTSLALRVPSIVIPEEYNYMINTEHPKFQTHVSILRREDYFWDKRLFMK